MQFKIWSNLCSAYNRDMFDSISKESDVQIIEIIVGIILLPRFPCCAYTIQVLNYYVNRWFSDCIDSDCVLSVTINKDASKVRILL